MGSRRGEARLRRLVYASITVNAMISLPRCTGLSNYSSMPRLGFDRARSVDLTEESEKDSGSAATLS